MIITFFSYKGGVGRTMAMSNVAARLANRHGYRVLAIDWDLEAPGLHYYFGLTDADLKSRPGLIDLLDHQGSHELELEQFVTSPSPRVLENLSHGRLDLLTCGRLDNRFTSRVADFNWQEFYEKRRGGQFFRRLKEKIESSYDICLIDARAGQSDTNVPPTSQLADLLVMLFTSNDQSIAGTEDICRRIHSVYSTRQDTPQVPIIIAPSRVFSGEEGYRRWIKHSAAPAYQRLIDGGVLLRRHQPKGVEHVTLAIDPAASFGEQLPVLDTRASMSMLVQGYVILSDLILDHKNNEDLLWRPERVRNHGSFGSGSEAKLRDEMTSAVSRGDEIGVALVSLRLARVLKELSPAHAAEARSLATSALTMFRSRQDLHSQALAMHTLGQVASGAREFAEARDQYKDALALIEPEYKLPRAIILHDLGVALMNLREFGEAETAITQSLALKCEMKDLAGQAMSIHQLGNLDLAQNAAPEAAIEKFMSAQQLAAEANDKLGVAISSHQLGNVYARQEKWEEALVWFETAAQIHVEQENLRGSGITKRRIGDILERMGRLEEAVSNYRAALISALTEQDVRNAQTLHRRLAQILLREGQFSEARGEATTAVRLSEQGRMPFETVKNLLVLAEIEAGMGDQSAAGRHLDEAEQVAEKLNDPRITERCETVRNRVVQPTA